MRGIWDILYTRPNHKCPFASKSKDEEFVKFVKGETPPGISKKLSFDLVVNGNLRYPCRLKDFMNYLRFVEHSAENLKFYLWFRDYNARFEALKEEQKSSSPVWEEADTVVSVRPNTANSSENDNREEGRKINVGAVVEEEVDELDVDKDCLNQPYRKEIGRICELFLQPGSPLELNLSARERQRTLRALRYTTHPSAFKLAVQAAEYTLRWQSHPAFLRRQMANANQYRTRFLQIEGVLLLLIAAPVMAVLLILSNKSRAWRIFPALIVGWAAVVLLGSQRSMCWGLAAMDQIQLDPWDDPEEFGISIEEGGNNSKHRRSRSNTSTGSTLELRSQITTTTHTKSPSTSSSSAAIDEESNKEGFSQISNHSRVSSSDSDSDSELSSLGDDDAEITECKERIARFHRMSWMAKTFARGVSDVEREIRRTQVHMAYQQLLLGVTATLLMLVATLPLPEYGII